MKVETVRHTFKRKAGAALAVVLTTALLAPLTLVGLAAPAQAEALNVTNGEMSWGIDATYLSVFSDSDRQANEPAAWSAGNTTALFRVDTAKSGYDQETKTGTINFSGAVRVGVIPESGEVGKTPGNYFYLRNPRIVLAGNTGSLIAETVAGSSYASVPGLPTTAGSNVAIATLDLTHIGPSAQDGTFTWTNVPVAITEAGTTYLAHYASKDDEAPVKRDAGSALEPITFSITPGTDPAPEVEEPGTGEPTPPEIPEDAIYGYRSTMDAGYTPRSLAWDAKHDVVWIPFNYAASYSPEKAGIGYFDAKTGAVADLKISTSAEPEELVIDTEASRLYVLHYRGQSNDEKTASITIIDTDTKEVVKEIRGIPRYGENLTLDADAQVLYFGAATSDRTTSDSLYALNVETEELSEYRVPESNQADLSGLALDAASHRLYVASSVLNKIIVFDTKTSAYLEGFSITAAKVKQLTFDAERNRLFALFNAKNGETWSVKVINTQDRSVIAQKIDVGNTARDMAVVDATGLLLVTNGLSNTLSVVNPVTRKVLETIDFGDLGVTDKIAPDAPYGVRSMNANVWAVEVDQETERAYVTHPFWGDRVSILDRVGDIPEDGEVLPEDPDEDDNTGGETPTAPETPKQPTVTSAPDGARSIQSAKFSWGISEYAKSFSKKYGFNGAAFDSDSVFTFTNGTGWHHAATGKAYASWDGVVQYIPYGTLAPVEFIFANPVLEADGTGTGTLSFDVQWVNGAGERSEFERVTVATFPFSAHTTGGQATFNLAPDFAGRKYTNPANATTYPNSFPAEFIDFLSPDIRAWWYSSGASQDYLKPPVALTGSFALGDVIKADLSEAKVALSTTNVAHGNAAKIKVKVQSGSAPVTGKVAISVDGKAFKTVALAADGTVTVELSKSLSVGKHTVEVRYLGNERTAPASATSSVTITKSTANAALTVKNTSYGVARKATAAVKSNGKAASGKVTFYVAGKKFKTVNLSAKGVASVNLSKALRVGQHKVEARYLGNSTTSAAKVTKTLSVAKAKTKVTLKLSKSSAKRAVTALTATIRVKVPGTSVKPTGKVQIRVNGKTVKTVTLKARQQGTAKVKLPTFKKKGTAKVTVRYLGSTTLKAQGSAIAKVRVK
ncbi:Ig-like domain repeat protein [Populibacterium corticicola]|uniref:Ig-like domain repeat protein n=1 Tax=Populibacterium corticicola TaxID=1812826 RepID=A0ABW5XCU0_9MICO